MRLKAALVILTMALFLGASVAATPAMAEAEKTGALLLSGDTFPIIFNASNEGGKLETVGGKVVQCSKEEASGTIESATTGKASDDLSGCRMGKIACRSENSKGEKDPIEIVLVQNIKGVLFSEKTTTGELVPGISSILTETLIVNCGGVKDMIRGNVSGLALPGLTQVNAGSPFELRSREEKGKAITGTCVEPEATCKEIAEHPLEANLGTKFEAAATELTASVILSKMVLIGD